MQPEEDMYLEILRRIEPYRRDQSQLTGTLDEYLSVANEKPPQVRNWERQAVKLEIRAFVQKVQKTEPGLLPWFANRLLEAMNPAWAVERFDAKLEAHFTHHPDWTPVKAASIVCTLLRVHRKYLPLLIKRAQLVKDRLAKRQRRAEQQRCSD